MSDFSIIVKKYSTETLATKRVNEFIQECNENGTEILDIQTDYNSMEYNDMRFHDYVFIFKLRE